MKILLADDDHVSRRLMERMLRSNGYDVVTAENGRQAMHELSAEDGPRLALLDWMMPELDGLSVCQEIRARSEESYVYILLLTSRESADDIVEGLKAGADDYLTKPCHAAELKARLHAGQRILMLEDKLVESREAMRFEATHDALTSVLNRGAILAQAQRELRLSQASAFSTSLLLCDIDHFKRVNDNYGHLVGDEILRQVSSRLTSCVGPCDLVGRYGGEEFLVLLTQRNQDGFHARHPESSGGEGFVERTELVREAIRSRPFYTQAGPLSISMSIGAMTISPLAADTQMEALLARVDEALYSAKAAGRDRIIFAASPQMLQFEQKLSVMALYQAS